MQCPGARKQGHTRRPITRATHIVSKINQQSAFGLLLRASKSDSLAGHEDNPSLAAKRAKPQQNHQKTTKKPPKTQQKPPKSTTSVHPKNEP